MIASVILIISGYVFIHLNNLSKQKSNDQCHRCGSATFGRKCLKCGYENYAKEDFKANSFMSFCGVIFLLAGIALLPITYVRTNNVSKNKVVDFISNIVGDIEIITDVEDDSILDDQDNIIDNTPVENTIVNNTVTNNTNKNTSTNTTTNKGIGLTLVGAGKSYNKCKVNSFTGTIKKVNPNQYMFNYSINFTNNQEEAAFTL
ncbi:MAG: hypothetical protein J6X02_05635, partial [Bacilli bacterium]|nr:hypothetical protein [Bacilli bacterium]